MVSTCFCSVIHSKNILYFQDFLKSLQTQIDTDFTLLLFNDDIVDIDSYMEAYNLPYRIYNSTGSIATIRYKMLQELLKTDFEFVIFGDTDDFFPANRIAVNKILLQDNDIVVNDLWLTNSPGKIIRKSYWKNRDILNEPINYQSITDYNFIGLGNSAIRIRILKDVPNFDTSLQVVDWFLYSVLLYKNNLKVIFTSKTYIFYRQHLENLIGIKEITLQKLKDICNIKSKHYKLLSSEISGVEEKALRYENFLKENHFNNTNELNKFITQNPTPFWWEEFIL